MGVFCHTELLCKQPSEDDPFWTITVIGADVVALPAASRAVAVKICVPFEKGVVSHDRVYGRAVNSAPRSFPSTLSCTPTTLMLSRASAETETVRDTVAFSMGSITAAEGAVMSELVSGMMPKPHTVCDGMSA